VSVVVVGGAAGVVVGVSVSVLVVDNAGVLAAVVVPVVGVGLPPSISIGLSAVQLQAREQHTGQGVVAEGPTKEHVGGEQKNVDVVGVEYLVFHFFTRTGGMDALPLFGE
jgi:hypothetical protein